ncbi:MAG TPA: hypothetical protein P5567_03190 [Kiritimatiellia bacterium]|nr:hypothetical protein [Kiritimatiellia bacterium]HRZ11439.1 hypothetical protein [Kiritimatiellia bacterium]HSA17010.1 hypothetical protein [Kiritimatiellia bacterium]
MKKSLVFMAWALAVGGSLRAGAASSAPAGTGSFSPLARQLWKAGGPGWVRSEKNAFHVYGRSPWEVGDVRAEAESAWPAIEESLGPDPAPRPARIFVVGDRALWGRVLRGADRRKDSLAIQAGDEVFLLREPDAVADPGRLPHELVHLKLWRRFGDRVPLWLDEGLASYLGWAAAARVARAGRAPLDRRLPLYEAAQLQTMEEVQAVRSYSAMGPAFYRQAEEMVAAVARRAGDGRLGEFAEAVALAGVSWQDYLKQLGLSDVEREDAEKDMRDRVTGKAH